MFLVINYFYLLLKFLIISTIKFGSNNHKSINPKIITKEVFEILEKTGKETKSTSQTGKLIQPASAIAELLK